MSQTAESLSQGTTADAVVLYEQPLNERMRTFLRLEFLFNQLLYQADQPDQWASRTAVVSLLDILAILTRGDLRGDVMKELERQAFTYERYQRASNVDGDRVAKIVTDLQALRGRLQKAGPQYLQPLRESEFLNAIRHRSTIPGGTCGFDLPDYSYWLRQDAERRQANLQTWIQSVRPVCDGVVELLWLLRQSREPAAKSALNGVYQHSMERGDSISLVRVSLPSGCDLYPEVSGGQHRFTVRFMEWSAVNQRPVQTTRNVEFLLTTC